MTADLVIRSEGWELHRAEGDGVVGELLALDLDLAARAGKKKARNVRGSIERLLISWGFHDARSAGIVNFEGKTHRFEEPIANPAELHDARGAGAVILARKIRTPIGKTGGYRDTIEYLLNPRAAALILQRMRVPGAAELALDLAQAIGAALEADRNRGRGDRGSSAEPGPALASTVRAVGDCLAAAIASGQMEHASILHETMGRLIGIENKPAAPSGSEQQLLFDLNGAKAAAEGRAIAALLSLWRRIDVEGRGLTTRDALEAAHSMGLVDELRSAVSVVRRGAPAAEYEDIGLGLLLGKIERRLKDESINAEGWHLSYRTLNGYRIWRAYSLKN